MKPKDVFIFIILIPLGLTFLIISALLYFNNGKSRKLVAAKLKLGALMLSFSWFTTACEPYVSCYAPAELPNSVFIQVKGDTIHLSLKDTLRLEIIHPTYNFYSFQISDSINNIKSKGLCVEVKDSSSTNARLLYIPIDVVIPAGTHSISIFGEKSADFLYQDRLSLFKFFEN